MAVLMVVVAEAGEGAEVCLCALFHSYEPYVCKMFIHFVITWVNYL